MQSDNSPNALSGYIGKLLSNYVPARDQWTPVDEALYGVGDIFHVEKSKAEELRFKAIKHAFNYHYSNNNFYSEFCQRREIKPDDIKEQSDLYKIPLVPDTFFKDYPEGIDFVYWLKEVFTGEMPDPTLRSDNPSFDEVIEALQEKEITIIFSSGSSGRFSFIPRDKITSNRGIYSIVQAHNMIPLPNLSNLKLFPLASNLGSTNWALMRGLAVIYELLSSMLHQGQPEDAGAKRNDVKITTDMVRSSMVKPGGRKEKVKAKALLTAMKHQQDKRLNDFIRFLEECDGEGKDTIIMETPFTIDNIMSKIEGEGKKFNLGNSTLITIGGWKLQEDRRTPEKEFRERVQRVLGIPDEACRDVYGMSECRVLLPPCEGHYKHIPHSILYPMVLNEELEPLGYGEYGRFAFLDPLANSFPGFIATGDRVKILESCPVCNRPGPVIEHDVSRVKGVEDRGCGLIMKRLLAEELTKAGKGQ